MRLHAGEQLPIRERLRHVIVRPELEAEHLVQLRILRGQHNDRRRQLRPHLAADVHAVLDGQHQIEQDEVRILRERKLHRLLAVERAHDLVAFLLQIEFQDVGDRFFIVYH